MHPAFDKRVFDKEAISLIKAGHEITHLCPGDFRNGSYSGVNVICYKQPLSIKHRCLQLFSLYKKANCVDADVYHCNEVDSWVVGVALKIFKSKKCVFDVHEDYPSTFAESRFHTLLQPCVKFSIRLLLRLLIPFTDRIVLAKSSVSIDYPIHRSKKILVRNFTPKHFNTANLPSTTKYDDEVFTLIHLGLFNKNRGWPQVLEALSLMKNKNIVLKTIGVFDDGSEDEFRHKVAHYRLQSRVKHLDWMPFKEAYEHMLKSHIGIVAFQPGIQNHVFAMPHKMFDYMSAGLAVLCPGFAVEVAPIIKKTNSGLLINSADPQDIANKLDALLDAPKNLKIMGLNGVKAVDEHYNWEAEAKVLIKMYEKL